MALSQFTTQPLTGGILCELSSNSTQDAVLILFLYFFFLIIIFEMTLGMVLTIQGKVPLALDESKETEHGTDKVKRLQNGK